MRTLTQQLSSVSSEVKALADDLIAAVTSDESYRAQLVEPIADRAECEDMEALRVYWHLTLREGFTPETMTVKYADYAIRTLRELGHEEGIDAILTPQVLLSYETVVKARQKALNNRDYIWCYGNDKLLMLLLERPESEHALLHLIQDRDVTETDQLLEQADMLLEAPLPTISGVL